MASTHTIHLGHIDTISMNQSPGLLFLRKFLPAVDSLDPTLGDYLSKFLAPNATFTINDNDPIPFKDVLPMLQMRSKSLSKFSHHVHTAWDLENAATSLPESKLSEKPGRTVMYESISVTVFKNDPEQMEVAVKEFNIIELEESDSATGLQAVELRTYMDKQPVMDRLAMIQKLNTEKSV
jgi:hypothetical protein